MISPNRERNYPEPKTHGRKRQAQSLSYCLRTTVTWRFTRQDARRKFGYKKPLSKRSQYELRANVDGARIRQDRGNHRRTCCRTAQPGSPSAKVEVIGSRRGEPVK